CALARTSPHGRSERTPPARRERGDRPSPPAFRRHRKLQLLARGVASCSTVINSVAEPTRRFLRRMRLPQSAAAPSATPCPRIVSLSPLAPAVPTQNGWPLAD